MAGARATLSHLFGDAGGQELPAGVVELVCDHRRVLPGSVYFSIGDDAHAAAAAARGALAIVTDHSLGLGVPEILVEDVRAVMAPAAARLHHDPSATLRTIGVTGTNGKSTTTWLVHALLTAAGHHTGLLGTVKSVVGGREHALEYGTTPNALDLQALLAAMCSSGDTHCVMEVSSRALAEGRTDPIHWTAAIFTNLTRDHLNFHDTMGAYYAAKRRLFEAHPEIAVINIDCAYGARLAREFSHLPTVVTIGIDACSADLRATSVQTDQSGGTFRLGTLELRSKLPGRFNVLNVLGAVAAARALGVDDETLVAALPTIERVPGRFEVVDEGQDFAVFVDYAHTPDALEKMLTTVRPLTRGRLFCVFGCDGDRDRGKRPQMGQIAIRLADRTIVTSTDNPGSERPEAIIAEILSGIDDHSAAEAILSRRDAIGRVVALARTGDAIVIAGLGHDPYWENCDGQGPALTDVSVAAGALRQRLL